MSSLDIRYNFDVKTPKHKGRSSFAITKVKKQGAEILSRKVVKDDRIKAINVAFKSKFKTFDECYIEIMRIKNELMNNEVKRHPKKVFNVKNIELVHRYFDRTYKKKKIRDVSKTSMLADLELSVKALGRLSLFSASEDEIQEQIHCQFTGDK